MKDFTKPITFVVTGTGKVNKANLRAELDDWVFGPMDSADSVTNREVTIIFPILNNPAPGMRFTVDWAIDVEADVQVVQTKGAAMTRELSGLPDIITLDTELDVLHKSIALAKDRQDAGDEVIFLMHYNEESVYVQGEQNMSDLEILCEAKNYTWLNTLNSEVMGDTFPNYESTDDRIKREALEKEFAEKEAAEKAATKKPRAPRKTAAKKAAAPEPKQEEKEPQKGTEGLDKLVADAVARDKAQPKALELKADIVLPSSKERQMLLKTVEPEDVWADVAKARPSAVELRRDELLAELGENIAQMGDAFSKTIRTYAALIEEVRNV